MVDSTNLFVFQYTILYVLYMYYTYMSVSARCVLPLVLIIDRSVRRYYGL